MALCGSEITVTATGLTTAGCHTIDISESTSEQDVRVFSGGVSTFGNYLACAKTGSVNVTSYARPNIDIGTSVSIAVDFGAETMTIPTILVSQTSNIDSKNVGSHTSNFKINGNPTFA